MFYELTGKLVEKFEAQQLNENFRKRDFVIESVTSLNGNQFTDYIKFQLTQDRCHYLDNYNLNSIVRVNFNIRGRRLERDGNISYFTHLDAWRLEKIDDLDIKPFDDNIIIPNDSNVPF
jgi:hypothetical protein